MPHHHDHHHDNHHDQGHEQGHEPGHEHDRGHGPLPEPEPPVVRYWRRTDGAVSRSEGHGRPADPGWQEITADAYQAALADLQQAHTAHVAELEAADRREQLAVYQALRAAGIPHLPAARLSGHSGIHDDGKG